MWEKYIYADSPREAAEKVRDHMKAPDSVANVFLVLDKSGAETTVDLEEQAP